MSLVIHYFPIYSYPIKIDHDSRPGNFLRRLRANSSETSFFTCQQEMIPLPSPAKRPLPSSDVGRAQIFTGLSETQKMAFLKPQNQVFSIKKGESLTFSVEFDQTIQLTLTKGQAFSFGAPLILKKPYFFTATNQAIMSFSHATFEVIQWPVRLPSFTSAAHANHWWSKIGNHPLESFKIIPMYNYHFTVLNYHAYFEQLRLKSKLFFSEHGIATSEHLEEKSKSGLDFQSKSGPTIMIIGPSDTGKSTLLKILLNYAVTGGFQPIFVDLDCGQNSLMPGTLTANVIKKTMNISRCGDGQFDITDEMVMFFGHSSPGVNIPFYCHQASNLAQIVSTKAQNNLENLYSGAIINTCGWVTGDGLPILHDVISSFKPSHILCLGDNSLYEEFKTFYQEKTVFFIPKIQSITPRIPLWRKMTRSLLVQTWFQGFSSFPEPIVYNSVSKTFTYPSIPWLKNLGKSSVSEQHSEIIGDSEESISTTSSSYKSADQMVKFDITSQCINVPIESFSYYTVSGDEKSFSVEKVLKPSSALLLHCVLYPIYLDPEKSLLFSSKKPSYTKRKRSRRNEKIHLTFSNNCAGFLFVSDINEHSSTLSLLTPTMNLPQTTDVFIGDLRWRQNELPLIS